MKNLTSLIFKRRLFISLVFLAGWLMAIQLLPTLTPTIPKWQVFADGEPDDLLGGPATIDGPDFNGDGYADLAISAPSEDISSDGFDIFLAGAVHVIYGSSNGLDATSQRGTINDQFWHFGNVGIDINHDGVIRGFGKALAYGDYNNDGFDDLAIGIPNSLISGAVQILYGSPIGLTTNHTDTWTHSNLNIPIQEGVANSFGRSLIGGDFNGDSYDDLAIGIPLGENRSGAVSILYGSELGLNSTFGGSLPSQYLTQDNITFFPNAGELLDTFGYSLASGDFNNDEYNDLAIGVPNENFGGDLYDAGMVHIVYGSVNGLITSFDHVLSPQDISANTNGIENNREAYDHFGLALEAADFDGDGYDDLAISSPYESINSGNDLIVYAGAVNIVYGDEGGLNPALGAPVWHLNREGIPGQAESNDKFGRSLAAGDFNNDGFADLVIGIPFDDIGGNSWGGSILRLNGTPKGLTAADNLFLNELYDINNTILFGYAISVLDFNGDGFSDLVVGASNSSVNGTNKAGAVFTYTNLTNGTFSINYQKWHQGGNGLADSVEAFDSFGEAFP